MKRILQLLTAVMSLSVMGTVQTWAEFTSSSDSATLAAESYPRRMVMEEATATWCGWCPQGIVAIDGLKRDFPDNFLAIAIHGNGDKMAYVDEYGLQVNSYPSAFLNRQSTSVSYSWLKRQIEKAGLTTDKMVRIDSVTYVEADETYKVYTTTRVANLLENAQLRLVYVVTEDSVGPYKQTNNFAGESEEMGGFENLPTKVEMLYSDVARFIYPSCDGLEGSVPSTLEACKDYAYVANVSANFNCDDYGKLQLTVMLYDAATNTIVNADRMPLPKRTDLDKTLTIYMGEEPGTLKEKLGKDLYKVRSLIIRGKINGEDLATLRDMVGCTGDKTRRLAKLNLRAAQIVKGGIYMNDKELDKDNHLPDLAFECAVSLRSITVPSTLRSIGYATFQDTYSLREVNLNEGLVEIDTWAFASWNVESSLEKINIPSTVSSFQGTTFASCYKLKDFTFHPDNPYYTFDGIAVYTKDYGQIVHIIPSYDGMLSLPDECRTVQWSSLRSGRIKGFVGKNVVEIGGAAFADLEGANYLAFGSKLKRVGIGPFNYARLNKLFLGCHDIPDGEYVDYVDGVYSDIWDTYKNVTLYVPRDAVDKFRKHRVWGMAKNVLPIEDTVFAYLADTELDAVGEVKTSSTAMPHSIYSLTGVKLNRPIKGLNIVDGKKVMVK
jgi:hypothetical protein